ncbi:MAG: ANTAR domain-containing protein [Ruminococcus sp.]|nr:ANTAR domain-containing protein [Ruminococcus sp.]
MNTARQGYSTLIVSGYRKFNDSLKQILGENDFTDLCTADSISEAKRLAGSRPFDIIFIRMPAPDESSLAKAAQSFTKLCSCIAVFTSPESYDSLFDMLYTSGVYLIPLTPSRQMLLYSLDWLKASCERVKSIDRKNLSANEKIARLRVVNRAVWLLVSRRSLSEQEAQEHIESAAQAEGLSKYDIAQRIIDEYDEK